MTEDDARLAWGWLPGDGSIDAIRAEHEDNRQRRANLPQAVNPYTFARVELLLTRITALEAEVEQVRKERNLLHAELPPLREECQKLQARYVELLAECERVLHGKQPLAAAAMRERARQAAIAVHDAAMESANTKPAGPLTLEQLKHIHSFLHGKRHGATEIADAIRALPLDDGEPEQREASGPFYRHYKRQTVYRVIGEVCIQCRDDRPLADDEKVVLYQDIHNGRYYARRNSEFYDGRFECFEAIPSPPESADG